MPDLATLGPNGWDITNPIRAKTPGIFAQSAVPASVTGTTSETVLATIPIPAGAMGPNGALRIQMQWTVTNNANNKTVQVRYGGTSFASQSLASSTALQGQTVVRNRGIANSQTSNGPMTMVTTGGAPLTGSVDSASAQNLTITGTLANAADTITLEAYTVELLNP